MSQSLITNEAVNCAIDYILQHIHEGAVCRRCGGALPFLEISFQQDVQERDRGECLCVHKAVEIGAECIPHEGGARAYSDGYRL